MRNQIIFADGTVFDIPVQAAAPIAPLKAGRQWKCISVTGTAAAVAAAFTDNASYRHEWESQVMVTDENGEPVLTDGEPTYATEVLTEDLSAWSMAGDIIDKRNGVCVAVMGKPTEQEELQAALDELVLSELGGLE